MKRLAFWILLVSVGLSLVLLATSTDFEFGTEKATTTSGVQKKSAHIEMTFAHTDHAKQQCVSCHHNYQDETGQGLCLECHHSDQSIAFKMRIQFHELCMNCHQEKLNQGEKSGPLRNCKGCHTKDHAP